MLTRHVSYLASLKLANARLRMFMNLASMAIESPVAPPRGVPMPTSSKCMLKYAAQPAAADADRQLIPSRTYSKRIVCSRSLQGKPQACL